MCRFAAAALVGAALFALSPLSAHATEEFAACTARPCSYCHESPTGGGTLTAQGAAFARAVADDGQPGAPSTVRRYGRAAVLFVHITTAFLWFGTILYVHLILKPAYAAKGLPRSELRLGWVGIVSMAVTGTILTVLRIGSWHALWQTRFGVLLCVKIGLFLVMASTALLVTFVIGPRLGKPRTRKLHPGQGEFTPEDLALFDGREGRRSLVAVRGKVHDLTDSGKWPAGSHFQRHAAGNDLTAALGQSPHGEEKLAAFPVVGTLVPSTAARRPPHERGFFFMAYLNLGIVLAVLLVITLWHL